ncbi:MAG TPA: FtsH protease activity modulator HflK, partial [Rhizomicrobium sp.]|nr:FtsH protease activity modulator HflK [Rhizomicrobium sp.]
CGAVLVGLWLLSGIYFVNGHEQGIVLRFGKVVARSSQGINYHLPWPIETPKVVDVNKANQLNIGYQSTSDVSDATQAGDVPQESLMLTGDENIVDVNFTVFWVVKDVSAYLFSVENPDKAVKAVAESAMREVVGQHQFESIITQDRELVQTKVRDLMQKTLDLYGAGIAVTRVNVGNASPPVEVIDSFRDVQSARADQEKMRNAAEGYANQVIPEARGKAAQIVQEAEAYRQRAIAEAGGEAKQFLSVYEEYRKAPEVTRRRMYLETMSQVLAPMNKIILDDQSGKSVVPYLPLPDLQKNRTETVTVMPPAATVQSAPQLTQGPQQ